MTDVENTNMDNLPTPPRIAADVMTTPAAQTYHDNRGSPHSIDYETSGADRMVTPSRELKTAGSGRSSSPRPKSASPSEYLLKTTAARVSDGQVLERRRSSIIQESNPPSAKKPATPAPPSERLLKTTEARVSDVRAWHNTKGVIKHDEDIWWEQRKPLEDAHTANAKLKVESRLYEPTTSCIYSQRKKFPPRTTPDKHAMPGSVEKSPAGKVASPLHVTKIPTESALLRPTFNSQVKNVKNQPVPPPPPVMELPSHTSGPQNVPSRLFSLTTSTRSAKWKSREELSQEEAAEAAKRAPAKKVKAPSEHLVTYNKAMLSAARTKATKTEPDHREAGWNSAFKKDHIPPVEEVPPLPGQRLGASPPRRRSDGGAQSRGEFSRSLNSSLESVDQHQGVAAQGFESPFKAAVEGSSPAKGWQPERNGSNGHEDSAMAVDEAHADGANGDQQQNMDAQEEGEEFESY